MSTSAKVFVWLLAAVLLTGQGLADDRAWPMFPKNARVLFQGDSITDGNRGRTADPNHILGHGYQFIVAFGIRGASSRT